MPLRAPRLLLLAAGLLATTFAVSALWIQKRGWQQSTRWHAAALEEERQARRRTERLLAAERGARAALLAGDHPGDLAALRLGLLATSSAAEGAPAELPPSALYGLTQAVAARGYPRFPPWVHEWPGGPYDKDIEYARFTPDGSAVITAGDGCDWRRRDVQSGGEMGRFQLPCNGSQIALSADGLRLVVFDSDKGLLLWDTATKSRLAVLDAPKFWPRSPSADRRVRGDRSLGFTPGDRYVYAIGGDKLWIWEARPEKTRPIGSLVTTVPYGTRELIVNFSADGSRLVVQDQDLGATVRDTETGVVLMELSGHTGLLTDARFSPDGTRVLTTSKDGTARIFDLAGSPRKGVSAPLVLRGHGAAIHSAIFSPDGTCVATASDDRTVRLWNAATGKQQNELEGHTDKVLTVVFSPDGTLLVTADKSSVLVWQVDGRDVDKLVTLPKTPGDLYGLSFSPDNRFLLVQKRQSVQLFSMHTAKGGGFGDAKRTLPSPKAELTAGAFSPDGRRVLTGDAIGTCHLFDVATGALVATLTGHGGAVRAAAFSPDGARIATTSQDDTARLWNATSGTLIATLTRPDGVVLAPDPLFDIPDMPGATKHERMLRREMIWGTAPIADVRKHFELTIRAVGFSPDGRSLATTYSDGSVRLWDVATGAARATLAGHLKPASSAVFSPDSSRVLTSSIDDTARLWDARTGALLATFDQPSGDHSLARFSPDGTTLFTTSGLNGVVKRWDARTFAPQKSIADRGTGVSDLDFSPDGHRLLTIDFKGEVHLWNLATAEDGITFKVGDWSSTGRFTAGGTRLFTVSEDLKLSDASTGELIARFAAAIRIGFLSPDGAHVLTAGFERQPIVYSLRLADYVAAACALLSDHPEELRQVAALCRKERLARLAASARSL